MTNGKRPTVTNLLLFDGSLMRLYRSGFLEQLLDQLTLHAQKALEKLLDRVPCFQVIEEALRRNGVPASLRPRAPAARSGRQLYGGTPFEYVRGDPGMLDGAVLEAITSLRPAWANIASGEQLRGCDLFEKRSGGTG